MPNAGSSEAPDAVRPDAVRPDAVRPLNPYPGLRPFEEREANLFFGRRKASYELADRLGSMSFVAVLGASGSGKSSLVRCGLLPLLRRGLVGDAGARWRTVRMRPLDDPIGELANGLATAGLFGTGAGPLSPREMIEATLRHDSHGLLEVAKQGDLHERENLLIFVDQFEEIFRFTSEIRERARREDDVTFLQLLLEAATRTRESVEAFRQSVTAKAASGSDEAASMLDRPPHLEHRVFVLLTMRSDFLGDCTRYPGLARWVNDGFYLVPFLDREQRREVVEGPASVRGVSFTPRAVNRILNDVGDDPALLPVLQHALMRTWDAREARTAHERLEGESEEPIRHDDYVAARRVTGALDNHLREVMDGKEVTDGRSTIRRDVAKRIFQRLTEVLPDGRRVRRVARFDELCRIVGVGAGPTSTGTQNSGPVREDVKAVVEAFRQEGRTFLSPRDTDLDENPLIDISHESLIWSWSALDEWIEEEARAARIYRPLSDKANQWKYPEPAPSEGGTDPPSIIRRVVSHPIIRRFRMRDRGRSLWYREPELQQALEWESAWESKAVAREWARSYDRRAERPTGVDDAMEFLRESRWNRTTNQIGKITIGVVGFGMVALFGVAERNKRLVEARARTLETAAAESQTDPLTAGLVLAELGGEEDVNGRGLEVAIRLAAQPIPIALVQMPGHIERVAFDEEGTRLFVLDSAAEGKTARILDVETGAELPAHLPSVTDATLVDAALTASGGALVFDDSVAAANAPTPWTALAIPAGWTGTAFSEDGSGFAAFYHTAATDTTDLTDTVRVWALEMEESSGSEESGEPVWRFLWSREHPNVGWIRFTSEGTHLMTWSVRVGSERSSLVLWGLADGQPAGQVSMPDAVTRIETAAFDANSNRLVTGDSKGSGRVWDLAGNQVAELPHTAAVVGAAFGPGGQIHTLSKDGTWRAWILRDSVQRLDPSGLLAFSEALVGSMSGDLSPGLPLHPSGGFLSAAPDGSASLWSPPDRQVEARLRGHDGRVRLATRRENRLATVDEADRIRIWEVPPSRWSQPLDAAWPVALSPDGDELAIAQDDGTVALTDRGSGKVDVTFGPDGDGSRVSALAWDPSGRWIAAATGDSVVVHDRRRSLAAVQTLHLGGVRSLAFSADGAVLMAASGDSVIVVAPGSSGSMLSAYALGVPASNAAIGRAGEVAVAIREGEDDIRLWDANGRALGSIFKAADGPLGRLAENLGTPNDVAFSPDGTRLAIATSSRTLLLFLRSGRGESDSESPIADVATREISTQAVRFLNDSTLVTGHFEAPGVRTWRIRDGLTPWFASPGPYGLVQELGISVSGTWAVSRSLDGTRAWPLAFESLTGRFRARVTSACLTSGQRVRLLGDEPENAQDAFERCRTEHQTPGAGEGSANENP